MKKFELTSEYVTNSFGKKMYRIKALVAFGNIEKGELGGFVEKESNLAHYGNAWVYRNACVSGKAEIYGNLDFATVGGFGSEQRTTTFFRQKDGSVGVQCGCFCGTLEEFREKVLETHRESKYAQEYLMIADLMELHFAGGKEDDER